MDRPSPKLVDSSPKELEKAPSMLAAPTSLREYTRAETDNPAAKLSEVAKAPTATAGKRGRRRSQFDSDQAGPSKISQNPAKKKTRMIESGTNATDLSDDLPSKRKPK